MKPTESAEGDGAKERPTQLLQGGVKGGPLGTADGSGWLEQGPRVLGQICGLRAEEKSVMGTEPRDFTPRAVGF